MARGKSRSKLSEQDFPYETIKKVVGHTLDPETALVTLIVLAKTNRIDISEWDIQEHLPALLYEYWASFKGKTRQDVLGIGELYHPFRIIKHRRVRGQWQVLVQWLGYSDEGEDVSWEPANKIRVDAPDVLIDYCGYVDDENVKAALLGPLRPEEVGANETKPAVDAIATPVKQSTKRKRESLVEHTDLVTDKRRRSSRYESTPATRTPAIKSSTSKRRTSQPPSEAPQATTPKPSSARRQPKGPSDENTNLIPSPVRTQPQTRRKSTRASSVAPPSAQTQRLSPADIPRTMLWFMDDFTVGDMQKVCRFIDEHCTGKLRLPLYSGGDWDGKAASGRWEDVFMVSPLGRLGRYDNEEEKEE
ncbi:chromo domain-containing protein [Colletotrichum truncatum]|uniref:Chromo domain-containing protein n=1 Tax=Colletotrichum truncatum TaxID=5467 RepID=A0ACC3YRW4_COLTU|nr:chromo domain-containing protein [Colletotrichum truncatum]KAF6799368.1 chromo domain-containing protein [Colletotrichum truncatum]